VSAANVDLRERVRQGSFRQDLWYRLGAAVVEVPPLRRRGGDVLVLARHFLEEVAVERRVPVPRLSPDAEAALLAWPWPGNVRELRTEMRRIALEVAGGRIRARDLLASRHPVPAGPGGSLRASQTRSARRLIEEALESAGGNRTRAAAALGISRQALLARLRRLAL
jgi:DNA-binding NtrC family response regulator